MDNTPYPVGTRVRLLRDFPSAWPNSDDQMESFGVKAGHLGTVTDAPREGSRQSGAYFYGVRLDDDPHPPHTPACFSADDLELAEDDNPEPPSRLHATPEQIHAFLLEHFCEDRVLDYQRAVGNTAVAEAADEITRQSDTLMAQQLFCNGMKFAAEHVHPRLGGGHWPSTLYTPAKKES